MILNKTEQIDNYEDKIQKEAEFWGRECRHKKGTCPNPVFFYDDPDIEEMLRGKYKQLIIDKATEKPTNRVLELGCGQGWLSLEVAMKGVQVDAYDISPPLIEMAKEQSKEYHQIPSFRPPNFGVKDLNKVTFEPETYDVVMIWDALHHIIEAERLLIEVKKGLKPNGSLILIDHIHKPVGAGLQLAKFIGYFLPLDIGYRKRVKRFLKKFSGLQKKHHATPAASAELPQESPFEDVTGVEMVQYIESHFNICKKKYMLCFIHHIAARIRTRRPLHLTIVKLLKLLDDTLVFLRILPGDYIFIWAVKE